MLEIQIITNANWWLVLFKYILTLDRFIKSGRSFFYMVRQQIRFQMSIIYIDLKIKGCDAPFWVAKFSQFSSSILVFVCMPFFCPCTSLTLPAPVCVPLHLTVTTLSLLASITQVNDNPYVWILCSNHKPLQGLPLLLYGFVNVSIYSLPSDAFYHIPWGDVGVKTLQTEKNKSIPPSTQTQGYTVDWLQPLNDKTFFQHVSLTEVAWRNYFFWAREPTHLSKFGFQILISVWPTLAWPIVFCQAFSGSSIQTQLWLSVRSMEI